MEVLLLMDHGQVKQQAILVDVVDRWQKVLMDILNVSNAIVIREAGIQMVYRRLETVADLALMLVNESWNGRCQLRLAQWLNRCVKPQWKSKHGRWWCSVTISRYVAATLASRSTCRVRST